MKWSQYYSQFYDWQASTQYSRLSSITDWGEESSPHDQIAECILEADTRTARSLLRKALDAGLRFFASEIVEIVDDSAIDDKALLIRLIHAVKGSYTGEQLETLMDCFCSEPAPVYALIDEICSGTTHFSQQEVLSLIDALPKGNTVNKLVGSTDACFTAEGLSQLRDYDIDESLIEKIARRSGIAYGVADAEPGINTYEEYKPPRRRVGLFTSLMIMFGFAVEDKSRRNRKSKPGPWAEMVGKNKHRCNGDCAHCPPHYGYRYGRWYYGHGHQSGCELGGNGGERCRRD